MEQELKSYFIALAASRAEAFPENFSLNAALAKLGLVVSQLQGFLSVCSSLGHDAGDPKVFYRNVLEALLDYCSVKATGLLEACYAQIPLVLPPKKSYGEDGLHIGRQLIPLIEEMTEAPSPEHILAVANILVECLKTNGATFNSWQA
jgi:hypothetical protein